MKKSKYPYYYYLALVAFVLLSILFWMFYLTTANGLRQDQMQSSPNGQDETAKPVNLQTTLVLDFDPLLIAPNTYKI
ncbi:MULTISPECIES: hypothetical protein [Sphingobacterium]|uniref:hypothetical protein n=1 Tax=Sphingobacterium TaxID=28453 RepID=UPI00257EA425|nr:MULTISPECIES: hypothetical protein [Sphingobacterium]